jgi:hypoxanthine phosphoribosyltransferase
VVEDIIDTGLTMQYLLENFRTRGPASVRICSLLFKPENNQIPVEIDHLGFEIPNKFVVGYGLDFDERYRNLPYIGVWEG